ncbi:LTA synthase family protein, partial [Pseudomonas oryzihabitans]|uniref:LTA synthase family protein n=1 Tax=Pseudomonas oryzihabitans TaxID=47885 RepID=UPI0028A97715
PYALPKDLPVTPVTGHGSLDEHLTAMRYADWSLGQFFAKVKHEPWYQDTLFVIVGDHGFGNNEQITEMDLSRFNVPLLLIGPGVQETFGARRDTVGSQIDVVPTVLARFGKPTQHQCWGRDLLGLPQGDPGVAVIKPSGSDQTVALVTGDRILVKPRDRDAVLYRYHLGTQAGGEVLKGDASVPELQKRLEAFIQTATASLLGNTTGMTDSKAAEAQRQ